MPRATYRLPLYFLVNVAFATLVAVALGGGGLPNPRWFYLILLFALCSTPIIDLDGLNGRYTLLALFMFVYFISFGAVDLTDMFTGLDASGLPDLPSMQTTSNLLDGAEILILVGGVMLVVGYRIAVFVGSARRSRRVPLDWSRSAILILGLIFWIAGTIATYRWNVYIIPDTTNEAYRKGLASISQAVTTVYLLVQMCQPLGVLLLAYAWSVTRRTYLLALVIVMVVLQIFIGFVIDVKGLAMLGIILVAVTRILIDGRLPKVWLAAGLVFVVFVYPYFTAYRTAIHGAGISRTAVVEHFGEILQKTIAAKDQVNSGKERAQTFLERSNVKASVEIFVLKTGHGVEFQSGHTLSPILQAFVPKILWPDKPRIPTGQLFNKQFHLYDSDDVFISPSHLGELYWNFGWPGAVLGMALIGSICGWIGARFNLSEFRSVTRILVTVITIKQLIVVFESSIDDCYVTWLRSLACIGILHLAFARVPAVGRFLRPTGNVPKAIGAASQSPSADRDGGERFFPHLMT